jgi:hypothetical protein
MSLLCMNFLLKYELGDFISVPYKCLKNIIVLRYLSKFLNYTLIKLVLNDLKIFDLEAT